MSHRTCAYASALVVLASFTSIACNGNGDSTGAGLSGLTGPSSLGAASLTAEPATIAPAFRFISGCRDHPPFDARGNIGVRARQDVFIRDISFEFFDRSGRRVRPFVFVDLPNAILPPIPLPSSPPVSLPSSHPIPIPGQVPASDFLVPAGVFVKFPFGLRFDCGVLPRGTLFVSVATADRRGFVDRSRITAQISE